MVLTNLAPPCTPCAVRRSTDGVGSRASSADVRDSVASVASPASAHGVAAGAGAKGHDPEATFPTPALEPRCQLPPLDDRVVGREEDVRQIEVMLVGEGGGQVPAGRQGGVGLQRSSGGGQAGGVGSGAGRAAAGRGHAVCVVGESGEWGRRAGAAECKLPCGGICAVTSAAPVLNMQAS